MPKYNTPIYYDEKVDFETFDISLDLNNEPQGYHIVLTSSFEMLILNNIVR